jgi:hypothetical protein
MVSFSGAGRALWSEKDAHAVPNQQNRANRENRGIHAVSESPAQPEPATAAAAFCNGVGQIAAPRVGRPCRLPLRECHDVAPGERIEKADAWDEEDRSRASFIQFLEAVPIAGSIENTGSMSAESPTTPSDNRGYAGRQRSVLFFTHHKCASAWLSGVLHSYYAEQQRQRVFHSYKSEEFPENPSAYRYLLLINADYPFLRDKIKRAVHVIRNPLSVVVSAYFSHLSVHPVDKWPLLAAQRQLLQGISEEEGMGATVEFLSRPAFDDGVVGPLWGLSHFDYDDERILTVRMEDLVATPQLVLCRAFSFLGEECPADLLSQLDGHAFENKSGGRKPGTVDSTSHYRSGNPSDWVNHLSLQCARAIYHDHKPFMDRFYPTTAAVLGIDAGSVRPVAAV